MFQCESCDSLTIAALDAERDAAIADALAKRLNRSDLPAVYRNGKRTMADAPDASRLCGYVGVSIPGLYLWGPAGTGKTTVAASFLAKSIHNGASGLYVALPDLLASIHASYSRDDVEGRLALIEACVYAPCLVLDDMGKEKPSEHAAGVLFEILDGRYRRQRPGSWLIVTSNYDLDVLCGRFPEGTGDPIRRRLAELTASCPMGGV